MTYKAHPIALCLICAGIGFSPCQAAPAPVPYVSLASANSSTPAVYNVPTNTVATVIYAPEGTPIKLTFNGISDTEYFYPSENANLLPTVTGPATITVTSQNNNGTIATIAISPITKTTEQPLPR